MWLLVQRILVMIFSRLLVGVWIGGVWNAHFQEPTHYLSDVENFRTIPEIPQRERESHFFIKVQPPNFEKSESDIMQVHTLSHSIPPTRLPPLKFNWKKLFAFRRHHLGDTYSRLGIATHVKQVPLQTRPPCAVHIPSTPKDVQVIIW